MIIPRVSSTFFVACSLFCASSACAEPWRLGVIAPLTGDFASYGHDIVAGAESAKGELQQLGVEVELFPQDACLPQEALTAFNALRNLQKVHAIAGNFCLIALPAVIPLANRSKLPLIHTAIATEEVGSAGPYIFTAGHFIRAEAEAAAEYAFKVLKARSASILAIETNFGEEYASFFASRFERLGGRVIIREFNPPGVNDFRGEITRLRANPADVVLLAHLGQTLATLLEQIKHAGIESALLGTYEAGDRHFIESAGNAANGLRFLAPLLPPQIGNLEDISYVEALAFSSTWTLGLALNECKGAAECVRDYLANHGTLLIQKMPPTLRRSSDSVPRFSVTEIIDKQTVELGG